MAFEKQKIILDCDPGHDDAVAIMLAAGSEAIDLLGITVVSGNQTLEKTVNNALHVCQYLGIEVPVYAGCPNPMIRVKPPVADDIHGVTGLDGPAFEPLARKPEETHGVLFLIDALMKSETPVTLVATGPMTNLGMALRLEPGIIPKIREIVFMGGSMGLGNNTPAAEFNLLTDADAAHVVFTSGCKVTMVGLDVSRKALCLPSVIERMERIGNRASRLFVELMRFFNQSQKAVFGWEGGPLHDPITIAYLIDRSVLEVKTMFVEVDIRSVQSYGRTNCDFFSKEQRAPNLDVACDIDVPKFWDMIEAGIRRY